MAKDSAAWIELGRSFHQEVFKYNQMSLAFTFNFVIIHLTINLYLFYIIIYIINTDMNPYRDLIKCTDLTFHLFIKTYLILWHSAYTVNSILTEFHNFIRI